MKEWQLGKKVCARVEVAACRGGRHWGNGDSSLAQLDRWEQIQGDLEPQSAKVVSWSGPAIGTNR